MNHAGSVRSVYSTASTARSTWTLGTSRSGHGTLKNRKVEWYQKPFVKNAFYTDLTKGPGTSHSTLCFSPSGRASRDASRCRNVLFMSALFTMIGSLAVFTKHKCWLLAVSVGCEWSPPGQCGHRPDQFLIFRVRLKYVLASGLISLLREFKSD